MAYDISSTSWTEADAGNAFFPPAGWPAGMFPNAVEPTARMMMGAVKRSFDRINPVYPTTQSTADSYVVTPGQGPDGYGLYERWRVRFNIANASTSPTINVSSLGPLPIKKIVASSVTALAAGDIRARDHGFYYDGTQIILMDPYSLYMSGFTAFTGPTAPRTYTLPDASVSLGYLGVPGNNQVANYTTVAADAGKAIIHPAADNNARTITLATLHPVDTAISFVNRVNTLSITVATADTITLGGTTTTGTRALAQNGVATAYRDTSTNWVITGTGLT